jgi:sugar-specific transcriptional regulator TrmB
MELTRLGLTEYEGKTYLALLELGQAKAGEIALRTGIPRNRVYDTLDQLSNLGLAEIILDETRLYSPLPFEGFLERRIKDLQSGVEALRDEKDRIARLLKPVTQSEAAASPGAIRIIKGSQSNDALLRELLGKAERRFDAALTPGSVVRVLGDPDTLKDIEVALARGVEVRLVAAVAPLNAGVIEAAAAVLGPVVRAARQEVLHIARVVVDGAELYLRQPVGDEIRSRAEVGFVSDSPILVADAEDYIGQLWEAASTVAERLSEISTGVRTEWEKPTRDVAAGAEELVRATRLARREIITMTDTTSDFPREHSLRIAQAIGEAAQRSVRFRLITRITPENAALFSGQPPFAEVRHLDRPDFRFQIVDEDHLTEMIAANPDGTGLMVSSTIRAKILGYRGFFEERWRQAIPLAERLEQIREGREAPKVEVFQGGDRGLRVWRLLSDRVRERVDCVAHADQFREHAESEAERRRERMKRGVRYRMLIVGGALPPEVARAYAESAIEVRYGEGPLLASVVVVDGATALVSPQMEGPRPGTAEPAFRWVTEDARVVRTLQKGFEAAWARASSEPPKPDP